MAPPLVHASCYTVGATTFQLRIKLQISVSCFLGIAVTDLVTTHWNNFFLYSKLNPCKKILAGLITSPFYFGICYMGRGDHKKESPAGSVGRYTLFTVVFFQVNKRN